MPAVPGLKACRFSDQKYPNQKNHLQPQAGIQSSELAGTD